MKRAILFVVLSVLFVGNSFCDPYTVKLNPKKEFIIEGRKYFIDKIVDDRSDKGKVIGTIGSEKHRHDLTLENDLESCFYGYLSFVFPKNSRTTTPLTMVVNDINCEYTQDGLKFKAKVTLEVQFIQGENSFTSTITNSQNTIISDGKTFSKLLERCLNDAITGLKDNIK